MKKIASLVNLNQAEAQIGLQVMELTESSVGVYLGTRCVFLGDHQGAIEYILSQAERASQ